MPFVKGQSGNPGGRTKAKEDLKALFKDAGPAAVRRIIAMVKSDDEKVAMMASKEVLDRCLGKPVQTNVHEGNDDAPLIHRVERVIVHPVDPDRAGV